MARHISLEKLSCTGETYFQQELLVEPVDDGECSVSSPSHLDDRHCLANIIGDLMFLLAVNSRYAQHLVGNTLVAISEFLLTSMLMIKLSSSSHIEQTIHVTWMHLVRKYFEDLLLLPISGGKFDEDDFLEGSPFCTSIFDPGKQNMLSRHLQRLTVFLFLKCSLNLVSMKGSPDEPQRAYENLKHNCTNDLNLDSECRSESLGLIKLHEWLQAHAPADILANDELYFDRCIHYDHQVLLDYLISKDTGSSCAEYLLSLAVFDLNMIAARSLRIVCNSWSLFVEFPGVEECLGQLYPKRQKVMEDCTAFKGVLSPTTLKDGGRNYRQPFVAARDCLVSLKTSINSLNQKNLFPYNPQVLLRR
ncbi:hypothetical protein DH2020_050062 [Rehmannia glutinosa]|uniref:Protein Lines C-terminal domain-containing protein n=1 Tax=Rehmannia glutinosa TaxID=99300 RepID=A0ABR0U115_REHGL